MNKSEAAHILSLNGFYGCFYGKGFKSVNAIDNFMRKYPRGNGISSNDKKLLEIYQACHFFKKEQSRPKKERNKNGHWHIRRNDKV